MDVFLMIRRGKTTIFTDAKETTPLIDVKRIIEGISKIQPDCQRLFREEQVLTDDNKTLGDYGLNTNNAKAQNPATLGLVFKKDAVKLLTAAKAVDDQIFVRKAQC